MNNFEHYITAKQAKDQGDSRSLKTLESLANKKAGTCLNCDELEWKLGGTGLCFSCTTGEADASDDYELVEG